MDDISEVLSTHQSMAKTNTNGICILVVNDDLTCKNIVSEMLQHCNYQVLHVGSVLDVLNAIWETKDKLDMVLTNAHKLESNGMVIVQHIQNKLNLPVILMCADKTKILLSRGQPCSTFAAYVLEGLSRSDVNNLWQFALEKEREKMVQMAACSTQEQNNIASAVGTTNKTTRASTSTETAWFNQKRNKRKLETVLVMEKSEEDDHHDPPIANKNKKPRVVWTREMHQKFLEAIEIIGYEKAVPKKIVEVMGIAGLTRENVASHLQKFRGSTKKLLTQGISAKESITSITKQSRYLKTHNYDAISAFQLTTTPNFGMYGDQTRSVVLKIGENIISSSSGNFVGYRLTNDGNSIEFGNNNIDDHQDNSIQYSTTEKPGNIDFPVQNSEVFSQMAQSFDDFLDDDDEAMLLKGTGNNKYCENMDLDWEDFDDIFLFQHDDDHNYIN